MLSDTHFPHLCCRSFGASHSRSVEAHQQISPLSRPPSSPSVVMTRPPEKKGSPKRQNSKESGASMLIGGAQMREPSNNPSTYVAGRGHTPPLATPASPQHDDLRTTSTVSSKDTSDKSNKFVFAAHPLQIDVDGSYFVDEGAVKVYGSIFKAQVSKASKTVRRLSAAQFEEKFVANAMIRWIQDRAVFEKLRKEDAHTQKRNLLDPKHGGPKRPELIKMITSIANHAAEIFKSEPRVLKVNQPVIVFGDIHGNLRDLMVYERLFWKSYPSILPWNYVFLGDYVDRSEYSLETILYLMCQKIVCRHKFFLIRGNHEFRNVNREFSFRKELLGNFGPEDGEEIWNLMNRVFDFMPMCAVINNKVFCCHGGVPASAIPGQVCTMKELDAIPCPYQGLDPNQPESGGPAWELVWNDPMDNDDFQSVVDQIRSPTEGQGEMRASGFATNTKRQTGKYFSEAATKRFLTHNKLDYVIRAHECVHHGYQTKHGGLTTTVFSSSDYSAGNNAAVVMVHDGRIRPVRVKTRNQHVTR